jgi:tol-pal system protein YbgF
VKKYSWKWAALCVAAAGLLWGCAPRADMEQLQQNQFALRGMVANDRQQMDALQERLNRLSDQVTELSHQGSAGGAPAGNKQLASLGDRVTKLEAELAALQAAGAVAPSPTAPGTAEAPPGTAAVAPPSPSAAPPTSEVAALPPTAAAPGAPSWNADLDSEIESAQRTSQPGAKLYRAGLDAMKEGKYQLAVTRFADLQHRYPKSELTEPAEYFAANALYETGKYDQSILEFNDLSMRFPKGRFASASLLRQAQAFLKLNDRIDARLTLQKLLNDHANSPEAGEANAILKQLASN